MKDSEMMNTCFLDRDRTKFSCNRYTVHDLVLTTSTAILLVSTILNVLGLIGAIGSKKNYGVTSELRPFNSGSTNKVELETAC